MIIINRTDVQIHNKGLIKMTDTKIIDETEMTKFLEKFNKLTTEQKQDIINQIVILSSYPSS